MHEQEKLGVFLCECGQGLREALDIDALVRSCSENHAVQYTDTSALLCGPEGQEQLRAAIRDHRLTRIVIAACSPREHEETFRGVLKDAGLNPHLLQMANVREQCAWVMHDRPAATGHASRLIASAIARVAHHQALSEREIECMADALVIGAGVAGMACALTLAQKHRKVIVVEKSPCVGGRAGLYSKIFPEMECSPCMLEPEQMRLLNHEQIEVLTGSEVTELLGFYGNFIARITRRATFVRADLCMGCGTCSEACPVRLPNTYDEGMSARAAIYTPYAGAMPNASVIDAQSCLRFQGKECTACIEACGFGAIDFDDVDRVIERNIGAVVLATGADVFDPSRTGRLGRREAQNVFTSLEFERMLSATGPTSGKIVLKNGRVPRRIALIHCVGSRSDEFNAYCSGVCCQVSLKFIHLIRQQIPDCQITAYYSDLCLTGKGAQALFNTASREDGVRFARVDRCDSLAVRRPNGTGPRRAPVGFDAVVLLTAMQGSRDNQALAQMCDIKTDRHGFLAEANGRISPVSTNREGIFVAGSARAPCDIGTAVSQGLAAAGKILSQLVPGEALALNPRISEIDDRICSGCKSCTGVCVYRAIRYDRERGQAEIQDVLCRGCGTCVAACPSGAITAKHFSDRQILAEIGALTGGSNGQL